MGASFLILDVATLGSASLAKGAIKNGIKYGLRASAKKKSINVYRVFGGDSRALGYSWTTVDPRKISNYRNFAGLPSGGASGVNNTADFLIMGKVNPADIMNYRTALPLDANVGGLPELIINPNNVRITNFSVLNP